MPLNLIRSMCSEGCTFYLITLSPNDQLHVVKDFIYPHNLKDYSVWNDVAKHL